MQAISLTGYIKNMLSCSDSNEVIDLLKLGTMAKLSYPIDGSYIAEGTLTKAAISDDFKSALGWSTGDIKLTYKTSADDGWVFADDGSIGNTMSGATTLASADCYDLFMLMWNNNYCTLQSFSGATSTKTTAIQDWTANKRLILPKILGRALGVAGSGEGLTTRDLGGTVGEETHKLTIAEMPSHTHNITHGSTVREGKKHTFSTMDDGSSTRTTTSTGGNGSHNNMQPTTFVNVMIKL
jgi:hypothetical protein